MTSGPDMSWLNVIFAFCVVAALLAAMGFALKYLSHRGFVGPGRSRERRLRLVEGLTLDARRRLVIVSCDGREHLLLLSGQNDIVVESNLPSVSAPDNP